MSGMSIPAPLDSDRAHLLHPLHHPSAYASARIWVSGDGALIKDADGREYIDGLSGLWNVNVGHGRRELADAAQRQMSTLAFHSAYAGGSNVPAIALAERLSALVFPSINTFFFTSGGAEATETSFKTARFYWKALGKPEKIKVISRQRAYHGLTLAAMSATGLSAFWPMFEPRTPGFLHIDAPDPYRFVSPDPKVSLGVAAANKLEEAILDAGPETVAAFIAEPVQGAGGVVVPPADYFPRVREICTRYDVLLIADEVITGFGRTGRWFGLEHYGVEPDIMQFAKGITSGYVPLGAVAASEDIGEVLTGAGFMFFTFTGNDAACAAAVEVLSIIEREQLVDRVATLGPVLGTMLRDAFAEHPAVADVRGRGMFYGIELRCSRDAVVAAALARDLWVYPAGSGPVPDAVMVAPPFVISQAQIVDLIDRLRGAIDDVVGSHRP